jgi:hypothetical protein
MNGIVTDLAAATTPPVEIWSSRSTEAAVRYLAGLSGIPAEHFSRSGLPFDKEKHGARPFAAICSMVNPCTGVHDGDHPCINDRDLKARVDAEYKGAIWTKRLLVYTEAFMLSKPGFRLASPLRKRQIKPLGGIVSGRFQIMPGIEDNKLVFFLLLGKQPHAIFYPAERLFLNLTVVSAGVRIDRNILTDLLALFLRNPLAFARWIDRSLNGGLRKTYLIGDNRPGHFIKESLAFLHREEETLLNPYLDARGHITIVPDWCVIDPIKLFPRIEETDRLFVHSDRVTMMLLEGGWNVHRVYRMTIFPQATWLRERVSRLDLAGAPKPPGKRFKLAFVVDAEKGRMVNQTEMFRFVIQTIGEACRKTGEELEVVWDGWTAGERPNAHDLKMMGKIEEHIAAITQDIGVDFTQTRVFGRTALGKIPFLKDADLVLAVQGTGAVVPCWLLGRATISYHVAEILKDRSCLDEAVAVNVDLDALELTDDDNRGVGHLTHFRMAFWGMEEAMVAALRGRITFERRHFKPA